MSGARATARHGETGEARCTDGRKQDESKTHGSMKNREWTNLVLSNFKINGSRDRGRKCRDPHTAQTPTRTLQLRVRVGRTMRDSACNVYRRRGGPSASRPCRHEQSVSNPMPSRRLRSHASWASPGCAPKKLSLASVKLNPPSLKAAAIGTREHYAEASPVWRARSSGDGG